MTMRYSIPSTHQQRNNQSFEVKPVPFNSNGLVMKIQKPSSQINNTHKLLNQPYSQTLSLNLLNSSNQNLLSSKPAQIYKTDQNFFSQKQNNISSPTPTIDFNKDKILENYVCLCVELERISYAYIEQGRMIENLQQKFQENYNKISSLENQVTAQNLVNNTSLQEIEYLKNQIEKVQKENVKMEETVKKGQYPMKDNKIMTLVTQLNSLEVQLSLKNNENKQIKQQFEDLRALNTQIESQIIIKNTSIRNLQDESIQLKQQLIQPKNQTHKLIDQLNFENQQQQQNLQQQKTEIQDLNNKLQFHQTKINSQHLNELQQTLQQQKTEILDLNNKLQFQQTKINSQHLNELTLQQQNDLLHTKIQAHQSEQQQFKQTLQQQYDQLLKQIQAYQTEQQVLKSQEQYFNQQIEILENTADANEIMFNEMKQDLQNYINQIKGLETQEQCNNQVIESIGQNLIICKVENERLHTVIDDMYHQLDGNQSQVNEQMRLLREELSHLRNTFNDAKIKMQFLKQENQRLNQILMSQSRGDQW